MIGRGAARIQYVLMGREIVMITLIVKELFSAAMAIAQMDQQEWTVAIEVVKVILIVQIKIAMLAAMSVKSVLIGQIAAKPHHVLIVRVTVIITLIARERYSVAMIIV